LLIPLFGCSQIFRVK